MPFVRTSIAPERVALFGSPNAGKSYAAFCIARRLQQSKSPAVIWYLDNDNGYFDLIDTEFPDLTNIQHLPHDAMEFEEFEMVVAKALSNANPKRGDWIVVDRGELIWEAAQDAYTTAVRGVDVDEWRMQVNANQLKGGDKDKRGGQTGFEWALIKKMHRKPWTKLITSGCNVLALYGEKKVGKADGDFATATQEQVDIYGSIGKMPAGGAGVQEIIHMYRDCFNLRCASLNREDYRITAAKARGREVKLENAKITDASIDILLKVCGWKMGG